MKIQIKRLQDSVPMPKYQTPGSAAFDFTLLEDISISPLSIAKVPTGLVVCTPPDHVLIISARSSSPLKKGITCANGIGVVDSDYCGPEDEIHVLLLNITTQAVHLKKGDRVAQGMIVPVVQADFIEDDIKSTKNRGGFGSTDA